MNPNQKMFNFNYTSRQPKSYFNNALNKKNLLICKVFLKDFSTISSELQVILVAFRIMKQPQFMIHAVFLDFLYSS